MNVERLLGMSEEVLDDLRITGADALLEQLSEALLNMTRDPQQVSHQQEVSNLREQVERSLSGAPSNAFPAAWVQTMDDLGFGWMRGESLLQSLNAIIARNEITPATAAEEIGVIKDRLISVRNDLETLTRVLGSLGFDAESLSPDEFELGVLMPRDSVDDELTQLGREFVNLERIVRPFQELATGTHESLKVRAISSSDFGVFVNIDPETATLLARALADLLITFDKVLQLRKIRDQAKAQEVPEESLEGLVVHADRLMSNTIDKIAKDLVNNHTANLPENRQHEIETAIKVSLRDASKRVDVGYSYNFRSGPAPEPDATDEEDPIEGIETASDRARLVIAEARENLQFKNISGEPILGLPSGANPIGEDSGDDLSATTEGPPST